MNNGLPQGWAVAHLRLIADARMGETILAKQLSPTGVPVYSAGQANKPWGLLDKPKRSFGKATVIVSARGSIGFPKIPKVEPFVSTQTTITLQFPDNELSRFVCQWLRTVDWASVAKGGAIPMLTVGDINELIVPLAPLHEQRRIVAKLEKLLAKVDACQQRLAKIPVLLKRFRRSVLAAACAGRLTADWRGRLSEQGELANGWGERTVGGVIESLKYGTSTKCGYEKRGVPVLRIPNIGDGNVDQTDLKFAALGAKELSQLRLRVGDILLIRSNGSVSLVGKCALVRQAEEGFAYVGYLIRLRPNPALIRPAFLILALRCYDTRLQIELDARSTSGVHNINSEEVRALRLSLPPLAEQHEIVRRVEALFALADQIEVRYEKARAQVDKLTPSLLARAFSGKLVPQDPNDEPAEKLLRRIQETRNTLA